MWGFNILVLCTFLLVQGKSVIKDDDDGDQHPLQWPDTYSFQAMRIYLLAGFTEEYRMWRTAQKSRIDYNDGVVKSIVLKSRYGTQYQIHPETDKDDNVDMTCNKLKGSRYEKIQLEDILPDVDAYDFEQIGEEELNDMQNIKFYYKDNELNAQKEHTLWAFYESDEDTWIPTRYENKKTNTWLGSVDKHEIWEFNNFKTEVDDGVFNITEFCNETMEYTLHDKEVTQNMLFLNPENDDHVEHAFGAFKRMHKREYFEGEHEMRKAIFRKNMRIISQTNRKNLGYKLAINQFADRTEAEMVNHKGLLARPKDKVGSEPFPYSKTELSNLAATLPKEYDTRLYGLVSPVKNQETCGSCWTFGTTASMEGALARSLGKLITLSNQALVDCAWAYGAAGCDGGSDNAAYEWMMKFGLPTEAEYGMYTNKDGYCHINNMTKIYPIKGFTDVIPYSVNALKVALVNHGPLSVSVYANTAFTLYSSGIFYDRECTSTPLNHEVTLVGYGEENGQTYWILKNSWGRNWGLDGYMHIAALDNNCGVTSEPTYVVL